MKLDTKLTTKQSNKRLPHLMIFSLFIFGISLFIHPSYALGQSSIGSGVATKVDIISSNLRNGELVSTTSNGYKIATTEYDPLFFGVVVQNPGLVFYNKSNDIGTPVVSLGKVEVLVSNKNGNIAVNDLITTSTTPGVGEKATKDGYVIGTAMQNFSPKTPNSTGTILVSLDPHYNTAQSTTFNLLSAFQTASSAPFLSPLTSLRYLLAVFVTAFSFAFGFIYFGNMTRHGLDALGRNPLGSKYIQRGIIFNVSSAIVIIIVGVYLSYLILTL